MTTASRAPEGAAPAGEADSAYAWYRLAMSLLVSMIGGVGLWSVVVTLPAVEAEFQVARADAALPYTMTMVGFAVGGIMMGRLADRFGILVPLRGGTVALALGYALSSQATSLWQFVAAQGLLIGLLGSSATFGPIISDVSLWFVRRRGIAVAIGASGSYLAGTVWPPVVQAMMDAWGWRETHLAIAAFCFVTLLPLSATLRRRAPSTLATASASVVHKPASGPAAPPMSPSALQTLLMLAGVACCVAMAMPQVHIVAYCSDLGYGTARGAEMLSLMLGAGIVSRLTFGWIADRIGPLPTLLLASLLQALSLLLFLPFDSVAALYVVSALFGLSQGGIVPTYALIVRQFFPPSQAGTRVGLVLSATLVGMALGGWMSGALYDLTLSYQAAFLNGLAWNLVNAAIALFLLLQLGRRRPAAAVA
ncbi:MFS transporter [Thalassobaculum fulvum]|uniref:MFS transporter n=1 Tax=Thalassobaculum fulvum TaxID=1633335 RepID=A0A918XPC0_9PROT|nr:MFS transporter [Thalassobaculum fulvum]GHD44126.1 MFS transporter [Thalassobaculum fulvum]